MSSARRTPRARKETPDPFNWLSSSKPLDVIARGIELDMMAEGEPQEDRRDATKWERDPERAAVQLAQFEVNSIGRTPGREERYVWVADAPKPLHVFACAPSTVDTDANYFSRDWAAAGQQGAKDSRYFLEFAQHFDLKVKGKGIVDDDARLTGLLTACVINLTVKYGTSIKLGNLSVLPLIRPRFVPCLPLPSKLGKPEWRCTASGATWQAMIGVSRAFGGTRPPTVLVTGPPGCGKEAYARAVHFGQRRNFGKPENHESLVTLSLAGFGAETLDGRLEEILPKLQQDKGTLFLDEVDKADTAARSRLLRVLENRTYDTRGKQEESCDQIAFVVAAGKPLGALRGMEPPDFWTRMEIHIAVGDPLTAGSQREREPLLEAFFKFFWWDWVSDWLAGYGVGNPSDLDLWNRPLLRKYLFEMAIGSMNSQFEFRISPSVDFVAKRFAQVLAPHLERRQLSLRGLRTAVAGVQRATRSQLAAMANVQEDDPLKPTMPAFKGAQDSFKEAAEKAIYEAVGTVLQVLPDESSRTEALERDSANR